MSKFKFILISFLFISCSSLSDPIELAFGLKSYMPIKRVEHIIELKKGTWEIVEDTYISDKRPKYRLTKIKTTIFKYRGLNGTTFLEFFNNQLVSIMFYPADSQYSSLIKNKKSLPNATTGKDIEGNFYIKWFDKKLEKKIQSWLYKYS